MSKNSLWWGARVVVAAVWLAVVSPPLESAALQNLADPTATAQAEPHDPDYRLGPADLLSVSVVGLRDFGDSGLEIEVSNSGKIHVPYVGVLKVAGMTPAELQSEIATRLREQDLVKEPQVSVRVNSYRGNTVYILGEVMQPGQYYMRSEMHVMDLIGLSMGFPTEGMMYLYRRSPAPTAAEGTAATSGATVIEEAFPIEIDQLISGARPELNYRLQGGDMLYVPYNRPKYFFITGEVGRAGTFEIPPKRHLLATEAIAFAGGPTRTAKASQGLLVRYDEHGTRQEMELDFDAILKGRKPDFPIMPNDIIFIPGSGMKTFRQGFLQLIPNLVTFGFW